MHLAIWSNPENSERSQSWKTTYQAVLFIQNIPNKIWLMSGDLEGNGEHWLMNMGFSLPRMVKNVLKLILVMLIQICEYIVNCWIVQFKSINFMVWTISQQRFFFTKRNTAANTEMVSVTKGLSDSAVQCFMLTTLRVPWAENIFITCFTLGKQCFVGLFGKWQAGLLGDVAFFPLAFLHPSRVII